MKALILGDGILATELNKQSKFNIVSRKKDNFDITDISTYHNMLKVEYGAIQYCPYDVIINCVANTDTYGVDRDIHWNTNYKGVSDLVEFCNKWKIKLVQISTDYLYTYSKSNASENDVPVHCSTWYGYTKLLGEGHVQLKSNNYLIIRCSHKAKPFQYKDAWINQIGNFDYVDTISERILKLIKNDCNGIYNVGTNLKSIFDLAKDSKPNPVLKPEYVPQDISMNISKLEKIL